MQQFGAVSLVASSGALRLRLSVVRLGCNMQLVLPNGTTLTPTREAGLVQIPISQVIRAKARKVALRMR